MNGKRAKYIKRMAYMISKEDLPMVDYVYKDTHKIQEVINPDYTTTKREVTKRTIKLGACVRKVYQGLKDAYKADPSLLPTQ